MSVDPVADLIICPNSHAVQRGARFCNVCGARLDDDGTGGPEQTIPALPPFDAGRLREPDAPSPWQRATLPLVAVVILVVLALAVGIAIGVTTG